MSNSGLSAGDAQLMNAVAEAEAESARHGQDLTPGQWAKKNLFDGVLNSIFTLVFGSIALVTIWFGARWFIDSDWEIVRANLRLFMVGQFPRDDLFRLWVSGYIVVFMGGFVAGAMAHNAQDLADMQGVEYERATWGSLLRRFWTIIAIIIFFVSFARTALPYIGVAGGMVLAVGSRELGWRAPAAVRARSVYIGAALFIISMMVLAGTSRLGGFALGAVALAWVASETGKRDLPGGGAGMVQRWAPAILVAVVVFVVTVLLPYDGYGWEDWGGLHITLFTTVFGIGMGMPIGILLALGRRSDLPVLKTASVIFIEFIRGVPLISLLLFSNLMLPLFLPGDRPADLTLAVIVITGFSAAYIAEIVRGGLQAVPKGQTEAAQASGMSAGAVQRLIVLPQALRAVIPAMVGQFISLFKDTSLLSIIGILEFLRVSDVANAQPDFVGKGLAPVTYVFVALGYAAFAYTLSKESRRLETRLGVGVR